MPKVKSISAQRLPNSPRLHDDHLVAGRKQIHDCRFHPARARAREENGFSGGAQESLRPLPHLAEDRLELGRAVVDHLPPHRLQNALRNLCGPRRSISVLAHPMNLPFGRTLRPCQHHDRDDIRHCY